MSAHRSGPAPVDEGHSEVSNDQGRTETGEPCTSLQGAEECNAEAEASHKKIENGDDHRSAFCFRGASNGLVGGAARRDSELFRSEKLAGESRLHTVGDGIRQLRRPLHDGLVSDANCLGGGMGVAAQKIDGFGFAHAPLNHSSFGSATMVPRPARSTGYRLTMVEEHPMESKSPYADRLAHAMSQLENPLGAVELAEALGITRQAIDKLLKGGSKEMSASNNARAARLLNVDPTWLATGEGTAQPAEFQVRWHERRLIELFRRLPPDEQDEFAGSVESRCAIHEQDAAAKAARLPAPIQDVEASQGTTRLKKVRK